ncbi:MAG TPA: UDP-2,3-diacylglucosamine diphosphatase LpxI [Terriglobales bacterium]|nr:UDP-2,3-diacylglucosamine diphosphatase LpxI [Terriglobales bacterium]
MPPKLGLIAGNGRFPFLVLEAARARGYGVVVAAIKEETFPEIEQLARKTDATVHWLSLGELSKLIETFKREGVTEAIMAGQVKHKQIFSSIRPDWRLAKLVLNLRTRNTDALIGAVAKVLADEGITLRNSTELLEPLLAKPGVLTRRAPGEQERANLEYGRAVARHLAQFDIGQTVVVAERACVAVEAMEGTDACIRRAGDIMGSAGVNSLRTHEAGDERAAERQHDAESNRGGNGSEGLLSASLTVVKIAKPNQDMRFDVPVVGVATIEAMRAAGARCLGVDAGKCLLLDGDAVIEAANRFAIAVTAD